MNKLILKMMKDTMTSSKLLEKINKLREIMCFDNDLYRDENRRNHDIEKRKHKFNKRFYL